MGGVTFAHGESVTHHAYVPGAEDEYGGTLPPSWRDEVWDAAQGEGVAYAPAGATESLAGGATRLTLSATLYDPLARAVGPRDEFTVRGRRFAVDADASGPWVNPWTGWTPGSAITLKAVSGG